MIKIKKTFNNGFKPCYMIYSDNYSKIKNKKTGKIFEATRNFPLSIIASTISNFEEINEKVVIKK